jgi:TPR repeat protein
MRKHTSLLAATVSSFVLTGAVTAGDARAIAQEVPEAPTPAPEEVLRPNEPGEPSQFEGLWRRVRNGDSAAQVVMARLCFDARPPRIEEGMHWLLKAAERDHAEAQRLYAWYLLASRGKNGVDEAVSWFGRAADQGDVESQYELGLMLYKGTLVARDDVTAVQWIRLAAGRGHSEAQQLLKEMELLLNPDHLAAARKRAEAFRAASTKAAVETAN